MNLPLNKPQGGSGKAGAVAFGVPQKAAPANFTVGSIQFSNAQLPPDVADEVMEQMADSIVELTHQLEEANARVAVLEEEQKILVKRFDARLHAVGITAVAKAAVTEGGTGYSGAERPEPSPQFSETPQTDLWLKQQIVCNYEHEMVSAGFARVLERERDEAREQLHQLANDAVYKGNTVAYIYDKNQAYKTSIDKLVRERDEARIQYRSTEALGIALVKTIGEMKAERVDDRLKLADWRDCARRLAAAVEYYHPDLREETEGGWSEERAAIALFDELECQHQVKRDDACRESCRDKAAADGGWANI